LEGVKALADTIMQMEDHLDILVNNAGTIWMAPIESYPEKGWDKVMDLNVKSPFFLVQALLGHLKAGAKPGQPAKVINITSIDGITVNSVDTFAYQASKAAFAHLTKRLAADLIKHNIVVSALAPGAFASDLNTIARDHGEMVAAAIPAKRVGTTEDMAGTAIYLASRAGDYMVGEAVIIDGGLTAIGRGQA
jgi:NAD(P)-dependent dehydrogenase (short-subunit alcohol dehydrogenase family)